MGGSCRHAFSRVMLLLRRSVVVMQHLLSRLNSSSLKSAKMLRPGAWPATRTREAARCAVSLNVLNRWIELLDGVACYIVARAPPLVQLPQLVTPRSNLRSSMLNFMSAAASSSTTIKLLHRCLVQAICLALLSSLAMFCMRPS